MQLADDFFSGCGLNVFNEQPMTSLVQLPRNTPNGNKRRANLSIERTAAVILAKFEEMWTEFIAAKGSFELFLGAYLKRWMHSYVFFYITHHFVTDGVSIL